VFVELFVPETRGMSLESVSSLFGSGSGSGSGSRAGAADEVSLVSQYSDDHQ
jgi:hypothetical protein